MIHSFVYNLRNHTNKSMNKATFKNSTKETHPNKFILTRRKETKNCALQILLLLYILTKYLIGKILEYLRFYMSRKYCQYVKMAKYENIKRMGTYIYDSRLYLMLEMVVFWFLVVVVGILALICHLAIFIFKTIYPPIRKFYRRTHKMRIKYKTESLLILRKVIEEAPGYCKIIWWNYVYLHSVIAEMLQNVVEFEVNLIDMD